MLPQLDLDFLEERGGKYSISMSDGMLCVVLSDFLLPQGFDSVSANLLLRLTPGFPDIPPDMWWFEPPLCRVDRAVIQATDIQEQHIGRTWQRWSRHLTQGQWQSGIDMLENFVALIRSELARCAT